LSHSCSPIPEAITPLLLCNGLKINPDALSVRIWCRRRAVSELQLMHNYGEFIHSSQRQEWLQMKLQDMYSASVSTPQESTPKIADHRPPKPQKHKMEENKPKTAPQKTLHRHSTKDNTLKPGIQ
uniref:Parathyroid hormone n=1 Tax=Xenopus tropicalis TaxID=8364 RepID=A0A6I8PW50_XENTR